MLTIKYKNDLDEAEYQNGSTDVSVVIPTGKTAEIIVDYRPSTGIYRNYPHYYYYESIQVYPATKDYTFTLAAKPNDDIGYQTIHQEQRTTSDITVYSYADVEEYPNFYRWPTKITLLNESGAELSAFVSLAYRVRHGE